MSAGRAKGGWERAQPCGPTTVSGCDSCACPESDVRSLNGGSLFFSLSHPRATLVPCPFPSSGRASAFRFRSAQSASTPRRNVTARSRWVFMLAPNRVVRRRRDRTWYLNVNSRRSPRCLKTAIVRDAVRAPTMPPAFAPDKAATVRPTESASVPRDYECHLCRCVYLRLDRLRNEPMEFTANCLRI